MCVWVCKEKPCLYLSGIGFSITKARKDVAVDSSGYVYVPDQGNNRIQKFTADGTFITLWGSKGSGNGQFNGPRGVAIDSSGNVYVSDFGNNLIQKFAPST